MAAGHATSLFRRVGVVRLVRGSVLKADIAALCRAMGLSWRRLGIIISCPDKAPVSVQFPLSPAEASGCCANPQSGLARVHGHGAPDLIVVVAGKTFGFIEVVGDQRKAHQVAKPPFPRAARRTWCCRRLRRGRRVVRAGGCSTDRSTGCCAAGRGHGWGNCVACPVGSSGRASHCPAVLCPRGGNRDAGLVVYVKEGPERSFCAGEHGRGCGSMKAGDGLSAPESAGTTGEVLPRGAAPGRGVHAATGVGRSGGARRSPMSIPMVTKL